MSTDTHVSVKAFLRFVSVFQMRKLRDADRRSDSAHHISLPAFDSKSDNTIFDKVRMFVNNEQLCKRRQMSFLLTNDGGCGFIYRANRKL